MSFVKLKVKPPVCLFVCLERNLYLHGMWKINIADRHSHKIWNSQLFYLQAEVMKVCPLRISWYWSAAKTSAALWLQKMARLRLQTSNCRSLTADPWLQTPDCRPLSLDHWLQTPESRLRLQPQTAGSWLQNLGYRPVAADVRLQSSGGRP